MRLQWSLRVIVLALVVLTANAYAADYFLKISGIKGESKDRIIRCPDGACVVEDIPTGKVSITLCDAQGNALTNDKAKITVQFNPKEITVKKIATSGTQDVATGGEIKSPRDAASGQATGKRTHKPMKIVKEWGASTPLLNFETPTGEASGGVMHWRLEVRVDRIEMK